jgi:hypothetical protein
LECCFLCRAFCCFLRCLLGCFVSFSGLLGSAALCSADLSSSNEGLSCRLTLGKSGIVQDRAMPLQQFLFGGSSGLLPFS